MKPPMIPCLLVAGLLGITACATPQHKTESSQMSTAGSAVSTDGKGLADRYCVRATGSHIVARDSRKERVDEFDKGCLAVGGRVYTRDDIDRTGEMSLKDALRKLDPSIRIPQ